MKFFKAKQEFTINQDFNRLIKIFKGTMLCVDEIKDLPIPYSYADQFDYWQEIVLEGQPSKVNNQQPRR